MLSDADLEKMQSLQEIPNLRPGEFYEKKNDIHVHEIVLSINFPFVIFEKFLH